MATKTTITINQTDKDPDFKSMLRRLSEFEHPENVYLGRSESYIVKMLLKGALAAEIERLPAMRKGQKGSAGSSKTAAVSSIHAERR